MPGEIAWTYTRAELWADGTVHAIGMISVAIGASLLLLVAPSVSKAASAAAAAYIASLALCFAASAAYNLWPVSRLKWVLRRIDQSAIYLLIAGTYSPFLAIAQAWAALAAIWSVALLGVALRLWRPDRYDRISIALYLLLGWSGVLMLGDILPALSVTTLWLIVAGGVTFSIGVVFHVWSSLRFQNAIWHCFVLVATSVHYAAVWSAVVAA